MGMLSDEDKGLARLPGHGDINLEKKRGGGQVLHTHLIFKKKETIVYVCVGVSVFVC